MKKGLVVLFVVLLLIVGCGKKEKKKEDLKSYGDPTTGVVVSYREWQAGVENPVTHEVKVYNTQIITFGDSNSDGVQTRELLDQEYQEIIDYAFGEEFSSLKGNIGEIVEGGHEESITVYYDNTSVTVNGANIKNKAFNHLKNLLLNYE